VRWVTTIAILAPLPYSLSRLLWAAGIPLGIDEELLREFDSPGVGSLYLLLLATLPEATAWFTHEFVASRRRFVAVRIPLVGGRPVRPALVLAPLMVPIAILAGFNLWSLGPIMDGFVIPTDNDGLPGWSFWGQVATFWVWGVALAVAAAAYWHEMRGITASTAGHEIVGLAGDGGSGIRERRIPIRRGAIRRPAPVGGPLVALRVLRAPRRLGRAPGSTPSRPGSGRTPRDERR
jgi:hypothetical protein